MNAATLALILFVSYASGASYYQQRRMTLSKRTVKPTTCSIQKLHEAVDGRIPSTITCLGLDVGLSNDDTISRVAVGVQCTYTYFCPNDDNASAVPLTAKATCNETGTWVRERPLCHPHDELMQLIYTSYLNYILQTDLANTNVNGTGNTKPFFQFHNLKKTPQNSSARANNVTAKLKKFCKLYFQDKVNPCRVLKTADQCTKIVKTRKNILKRQKNIKNCEICWYVVCNPSSSVTLL